LSSFPAFNEGALNVSLRILFADDSVTAQNMGRKILTDAGYHVVAVSNGAAAVKKIAEQKPDIIILDIYMPGYSGLEVCEKVRGSIETLKTPVLLTVGKMEPYKSEDGHRVKADGVIVKPFEASDLLAIVKKFEERISQAPARVQQPVLVERSREEEAAAESPVELPPEHQVAVPQPMVEVPDHMATAFAFSDLLGTEPSVSTNQFEPPAPPVVREITATPTAVRPIPDHELPVSWRDRNDFDSDVSPRSPVAIRPLQIPVYEERESATTAFQLIPTSASPTGEIDIPRESELEESAAQATRNAADATAPGLKPTRQSVALPPSSVYAIATELPPLEGPFPAAAFQDIPADIAAHLPPPAAEGAPSSTLEAAFAENISDADFEARVAAAMSAYSHAQETTRAANEAAPKEATSAGFEPTPAAVPPQTAPHMQAVPVAEAPAPIEYYPPARELPPLETQPSDGLPSAVAREEEPRDEPPRVFEYRPPVEEEPVRETRATEPVVPVPVAAQTEAERIATVKPPAAAAHQSEHRHAETVQVSDVHEHSAASIATTLPEAAAAATSADHNFISEAVHRVVERLKPELVDEILRELKSKKE
jgi:CheY-like chemotaxis protein